VRPGRWTRDNQTDLVTFWDMSLQRLARPNRLLEVIRCILGASIGRSVGVPSSVVGLYRDWRFYRASLPKLADCANYGAARVMQFQARISIADTERPEAMINTVFQATKLDAYL